MRIPTDERMGGLPGDGKDPAAKARPGYELLTSPARLLT
jgi:hypothetical protein